MAQTHTIAEINEARLRGWLKTLEEQGGEALCVLGVSYPEGKGKEALKRIEIMIPADVTIVEMQEVLENALRMIKQMEEGN